MQSKLPIKAARDIAAKYDWDQVIIVARKVGDFGYEHVVTFGKSPAHCEAAARAGNAVKHHLMMWPASLYDSALRVLGVGRDAENRKALSISLNTEPSDHDIRMIHEMLTPPTKSPAQVEQPDAVQVAALAECLSSFLSHTDGWDEVQLRKRWGDDYVQNVLRSRAALRALEGGE